MQLILEKYQVIKKLGKGAYGDVVLVQNQKKQQFAVKKISKQKIQEDQLLMQYLQGQEDCMIDVRSKYTVDLFEVGDDNDYRYMVLQYCNGGDLHNQQAKKPNKVFSLSQTIQILSQIIKGLEVIHSLQYLHRDIKSKNILINITPQNIKEYKLADFGFSKPIQQISGTVLGTPDFMAPQIFLQEQYSYGVDMWAFGVLFYFMLNSEYPFKKISNPHLALQVQRDRLIKASKNFSYQEYVSKSRKKLFQNCTPELEDLFEKIFQPNQEKRITFIQIREHDIFKDKFPIIEQKSKKLYINNKTFRKNKKKKYSYDRQYDIIEERFSKIKFLCYSQQKMEQIQKFISKPLLISFVYNILKYQIILLQDLLKLLRSSIYKSFPKLKFRQYRYTQLFKEQQNQIKRQKLKVQTKLSQVYQQCQKYIIDIKQINTYFQESYERQVNQKQLTGNFKASYRQSTSKIYEYLKPQIRKSISPLIKYSHIAIITISHFFNHFMKTGNEIQSQIFKNYCIQKDSQNQIEWKNLCSWIDQTNKQDVENLVNNIIREFVSNK